MKNGLLQSVEALVSRAFEYGDLSTQLVLQAGLRCLEDYCFQRHDAVLLRRVKLLEIWLNSPHGLTEQERNDLRGARWDEADGWTLYITTASILADCASCEAATMTFARVLTNYEKGNEEEVTLSFEIFLVRLLCCQDSRKRNVTFRLRQVAANLVWLNRDRHPSVVNELRHALSL